MRNLGWVVLTAIAAMSCGGPEPESRVSSALQNDGDEWVQTPAGKQHRACVHALENGAAVARDGTVTRKDGSKYQLPKCESEPTPPSVNGWITARAWTPPSGVYLGSLTANFSVPPAPPNPSNQLIYLFPGSQDSSSGTMIIQPVLQWGYNGLFGGQYWTFASWYVTTGQASYSNPVTVSVGDALTGSMTTSSCINGSCDWTITSTDNTTTTSTAITVVELPPQHWVVAATLEQYSVSGCNQYPGSGGETFGSVTIHATDGSPLNPTWGEINWVSDWDPDCQFATASANASTAQLIWSNTQSACQPLGSPCRGSSQCCAGPYSGMKECTPNVPGTGWNYGYCQDYQNTKFVFATSDTYTSYLGGLAGADSKCQLTANRSSARVPVGTYKAWLSSSAQSAASRLNQAPGYRFAGSAYGGNTIASNWSQLVSGALNIAINANEVGGAVSGGVWTGTASNGSYAPPSAGDWTQPSPSPSACPSPAPQATYGTSTATNGTWTQTGSDNGCNLHRIYCVQQ